MTRDGAALARRRGDYGIDAPYALRYLALAAVGLLAVSIATALAGIPGGGTATAWGAVVMFLSVASYLNATRVGKFKAWARVLRGFALRGDERLLDMGCGRGAVLLMGAELLPRGRAVGLDLWKTADQSGNDPAATLRNAQAEGVAAVVELETGDMRKMPFPDESFDVIVSSLAIHNIADAAGRAAAVDEAVRVLRPGGRLAIVDISASGEYAERLRARGMTEVSRRRLGWETWFGGPWVAASLVTARKPA